MQEEPTRVYKMENIHYLVSNFSRRHGLHVKINKLKNENRVQPLKYECDICGNSFGWKNVLAWHRKKVHFSFLSTPKS